jgi:hypothetical protein
VQKEGEEDVSTVSKRMRYLQAPSGGPEVHIPTPNAPYKLGYRPQLIQVTQVTPNDKVHFQYVNPNNPDTLVPTSYSEDANKMTLVLPDLVCHTGPAC